MNLYGSSGANPVGVTDPMGLYGGSDYDPFDEADEIIAGMQAEKAAAAHHAFAMIGRWAQMAAIGAMEGLISALFPPYGLYLSIQGAGAAMEDMLFNGISWNSMGMLGLSAIGGRASFNASMAQMQRISGYARRAYNRIGCEYAKGGGRGSGFNGNSTITNVKNEFAVGHNASTPSRFGWPGQASWNRAVRIIRGGGMHPNIEGKIPTLEEGYALLDDAGATVTGVHAPHDPSGVARDVNFHHINYTAANGQKGHLGIVPP